MESYKCFRILNVTYLSLTANKFVQTNTNLHLLQVYSKYAFCVNGPKNCVGAAAVPVTFSNSRRPSRGGHFNGDRRPNCMPNMYDSQTGLVGVKIQDKFWDRQKDRHKKRHTHSF